MHVRILRPLAALFVPGGVVVLGMVLALVSGVLTPYQEALTRVVPLAVLVMGLYVGLRFRRSRIIWASLILLLAEGVIYYQVWWAGPTAVPTLTVFNAVALLIPVNLGMLALLSERAILHPRNMRVAAFVTMEILLVGAAVMRPSWNLHRLLGSTLVDAAWINALGLPQPALVSFLACGVLLLIRFFLDPGPSRGGYVWALAAAWGALAFGPADPRLSLLLAAGIVALIISEAETSHVMAFYDELTGLPGRRALAADLEEVTGIYVAAMVDVDRFKKFNDTYGHDVGDQVLRMVASKLEGAGGGCRAYRYGGEEFTLLYQGHDLDDVMPRLESLRGAIEESGFILRDENRPEHRPEDPSKVPSSRTRVGITVSMGAAQGQAGRDDPREILKEADRALYSAKRGGRNKVKRAN